MNKKQAAAFVFSLLLSGCTYGEFLQKENSGWPIQTRVLRETSAVEHSHYNGFRLSDGARVGMRIVRITDALFTAELRMAPNTSVRLQTRTTPYDDSLAADQGIVIDITESATTVSDGNNVFKKDVPVPNNQPFQVEIRNQGPNVDVTVNCSRIARFRTSRPSTEWVIVSLPKGGSAFVGDAAFDPLPLLTAK